MRTLKMLRPDAKGRITLGILAKGVSGFSITEENDRIILTPYTEIQAKEKWLFDNQSVLKKVKNGIKEAAAGKVRSLGSFKKYLSEDNDMGL